MRTLATITLTAALVWGSASAAVGANFDYKNPTKPTKNATKLSNSQYRGCH